MTSASTAKLQQAAPDRIAPDWDSIPLIPEDRQRWHAALEPTAQNLATVTLRRAQALGLRRVGVVSARDDQDSSFVLSLLLQGFRHLFGSKVFALDVNLRSKTLSSGLGLQHDFKQDDPFPARRIAPQVALMPLQVSRQAPVAQLTSATLSAQIEACDAEFQPDLMLFDLPSLLDHPDVLAMAPQLDAVLLCVACDRTLKRDLAACKARLEAVLPVLGTVLTQSRGLV